MIKIITGDALEVLNKMNDGSVNCCITSPPYWGLRDYGVKGQLCLERTPEEYVAKMVEVFREVRRVLIDDGTLWLNLGDSYATGAGKVGDCPGGGKQGARFDAKNPCSGILTYQPNRMPILGLKPKDLVGIPWMVAFALRADGWYLRQDIIWAKPNPMPESVVDRCTKAHEYVFLMSKSERYFCDMAAIAEDSIWKDPRVSYGSEGAWEMDGRPPDKRNGRKLRKPAPKGSFNGKTESMRDTGQNAFRAIVDKRNKRSVWTVPTKPFKAAHFATFPVKLVEPCILAGCPAGGTVLDPFGGSGTSAVVAEANGRNSIIIEINPDYVEIAKRRTAQKSIFNLNKPLNTPMNESDKCAI
jgi:DNA modification methylase